MASNLVMDVPAYSRLNPQQRAFVDVWVATASAKEALEKAGYNKHSGYSVLNDPVVREAIRDRCAELHAYNPDLIASESEVLQTLTELARDTKDDKIRLQALTVLLRYWKPTTPQVNMSFDLKQLMDESERIKKENEQKMRIHR